MPSTVDPASLLRATDVALEAAVDPEQWAVALSMLAAATSSTGTVMFLYGGRERSSFLCSDRCAGAMDDYLTSGWCMRNPRLSTPPSETTLSDADFMHTERQARDLAAFRDGFLRKHDMGWFAGSSLFRDAERQILISVERAFRHCAFDAGEVAVIDEAFARLRRIVTLVPTMDGRLRSALLQGFEGRGQAAAILGRGGLLLGLNQSAEALLPAVLRIRHGHLRAIQMQSMSAWTALVERLTGSSPSIDHAANSILLRSDAGVDVIVRGMALPACAHTLFPSAAALFFFDAVGSRTILPDLLRSVFHLTPTEARLATELACRLDLHRAGRALDIGYETARSHLKAIFAKTATHSQVECIAKIISLF